MKKIITGGIIKLLVLSIVIPSLLAALACLINQDAFKFITARDYRELTMVGANKLVADGSYIKSNNLVKMDIDLVMDYFAVDDSGYYYFAPCKEGKYVTIYVESKYVPEFEKACEASMNFLSGKGDKPKWKGNHARLGVTSISNEVKELFVEYVDGYEQYFFSDGVTAQNGLEPYILYYTQSGEWISWVFYVFAALAIFLFILFFVGAVSFVPRFKSKLKKRNIDYLDLNYNIMSGTSDFGSTKFTNRYLIIPRTFTIDVVEMDKIVWAYKFTQETVHKLYGIIKTGTTYMYFVYLYDVNGNQHAIGCGNKDERANRILTYLSAIPTIMVGYSEDLENFYKYNRAIFIEKVRNRMYER